VRLRAIGLVVCALGAVTGYLFWRSSGLVPVEPVRTDIPLGRDGQWVELRVPRDATLESLLRQQNLSVELTTSLVDAVRGVFNPKDLRANQMFRITRTMDGLFREFRYQIDADRLLRVFALPPAAADAPAHLSAEVVTLPRELETNAVEVTISTDTPSLVGAFETAGENIQLALGLAEIFGGEVDFNSDLQDGDRVEVLFDRALRNGELIGYGDIRAAVLETGGRRITAVRFAGPDGKAGYYDEQGRSLKRQFLKSPLPLTPRITSRFSYRRRNPVHGAIRPHLGVDYAAPTGTAVLAVAAGVVEFAGVSGEAGRMIRIRHAGGYETSYLHLSAYAPGIRPGVRVAQSQTIGRVGQSGTATGPHLDYRISRNGVFVNPLAELQRMPKGDPIDAASLPEYTRSRDASLADLDTRLATSRAPGGPR
jgi:murein DD-endopeptidase MepM/ murein hydrolase activator NlpD